ncbi:MAG: diguanylate cyclase [Candidatus Polarisedimenticolaceae bacterium]|nr:diguanylate cyclase [Candidatus Polarisedimenticolaceae bacterium]
MTKDKDWQNEYYNLLEEQEKSEGENKDMESLLCRTISKLATASSGFDAALDPHLSKLKEVVRDGPSPSLKQHLDQFSNELMRADSRPPTSQPQPNNQLASKLVKICNLKGQQADQFESLTEQLLSDPESLSEADFNKWLSAVKLTDKQTSPPSQKKPGFMSRFFGADDSAEKSLAQDRQEKINQLLRELLEKLTWPDQWKQDIESFCLHLAESAKADEWKAVIESISTLAYHTFGAAKTEIDEAEDFLEELTQRLRDLDSHLLSSHQNREDTLENGRKLNQLVTDQVGTIGKSLDGQADLQTLKQNIRLSLDTIQEHVEEFTHNEEIQYKKGEDSDQQLKQRLAELENETEALRVKMLDAHHLALKDSVTSLPNRTAYEERMKQEYARWKRFGEPLSMLVWDIDDFKSVNDRFGHQAGDKALKVIATILRKRLRESDFIARYGGEEFVCLLAGTDKEQAHLVAEEMRKSVSESGFHSGSKEIVLTASCGISAFQADDTPSTVFARTDKALYKAKANGKNCCITL